MKKSKMIIIIATLILQCSFYYLKAQKTFDESFKIEDIGNSYNEKGYSKDNKMNSDGNLHVNPFSCNAIYNYSIYNHEVNGSNLNIELNYCSDVSFMSLGAFDMDQNSWRNFSYNRPVWIIGVNGFAVQVFSFTKMPTNRPALFNPNDQLLSQLIKPTFEPFTYQVDDYIVNWLIPGYDFCSRMNPTMLPGQPITTHGTTDKIKLLRTDGSVLELVNVSRTIQNDTNFKWDSDTIFTGFYYENSTNSKGFGYVTFLGDKDEIDHSYPDDRYYCTKPNIPRLLRFYPGDGLEYVFEESLAPFGGEINCNIDPSKQLPDNFSFGIKNMRNGLHFMDATPGIFYLKKINNQNQNIALLSYSRKITNNDTLPDRISSITNIDKNKGRGLLKSINISDFEFSYSGSVTTGFKCNIKTPVRYIFLKFDKSNVKFFGSRNYSQGRDYYISSFENNIDYCSYEDDFSFNTFVPYLSLLEDLQIDKPGNYRKFYFDYDSIETTFQFPNFGEITPFFLADKGENTWYLTTKNLLLNKIVEPTRKLLLNYATDHKPNGESIQRQKSIESIYSLDQDYLNCYYLFHNSIDTISYFKRKSSDINNENKIISDFNEDLYKQDIYTYKFIYPEERRMIVSTADLTPTSKNVNKEYYYKTISLKNIKDIVTYGSMLTPTLKYTALVEYKESFSNDGITEIDSTYTKYLNDPNNQPLNTNIIMPDTIIKYYKYSNSNTMQNHEVVTGFTSYNYVYDDSYIDYYRTYIESPLTCYSLLDSSLFSLNVSINKRLKQKTEKIWICNPDYINSQDGSFDVNRSSVYLTKNFFYLSLPPLFYIGPYGNTGIVDNNFKDDNSIKKENHDQPLTDITDYNTDLIIPHINEILYKTTTYSGSGLSNRFLEGTYDTIQTKYRIDKNIRLSSNNLTYNRGKVIRKYQLLCENEYNPDRILTISYQYNTNKSNAGIGYPIQATNANNSIIDFHYSAASGDIYSLNSKILYDNNTYKSDYNVFQNESRKLSYDYRNNPEIIIKSIRQFSQANQSLCTLFHKTYYRLNPLSQPIYSVNENNWISLYSYNSNKTITKATLPYDFPNPDQSNYDVHKNKLILTGVYNSHRYGKYTIDSCEKWNDGSYTGGSTQKYDYNYFSNDLIFEYYSFFGIFPDGCNPDYHAEDQHSEIIQNNSKNNLFNDKESKNRTLLQQYVVSKNKWISGYEKSSDIKLSFKKTDLVSSINSISSVSLHIPLKFVKGTNSFNVVIKNHSGEILHTINYLLSRYRLDNNSNNVLKSEELIVSLDDFASGLMNSLNNSDSTIVEILPESINSDVYIEFMNSGQNKYSVMYDDLVVNKEAPYMVIEGDASFNLMNEAYTVKYDYNYNYNSDDYNFHSTKYLKIDDKNHSNNDAWSESTDYRYFYRSHSLKYDFGTDYSLLKTSICVDNRYGIYPETLNEYEYDGFGNQIKSYQRWCDNSSSQIFSPSEYKFDAQGRLSLQYFPNLTSNPNNNIELDSFPQKKNSYETNIPELSFPELEDYYDLKTWFAGTDFNKFYGVCSSIEKTAAESEPSEIDSFLVSKEYYDAFKRLKGMIYFKNGVMPVKAVKFDYDELNRTISIKTLKDITKPSEEQTTRYWYDASGRIKYKYQPDLSIQSFAYDNIGNLRFSQNSNQINSSNENDKMTFYEYDDLNRLLIVGEAEIDEYSVSPNTTRTKITDLSSSLDDDNLNLNWLTDLNEEILKVNKLNIIVTPESNNLLTSNITLFQNSSYTIPTNVPIDFWMNNNCIPLLYKKANRLLNTDNKPRPPLIQHKVYFHEPVEIPSTISNFENIAVNPQNILRAYYYDDLPTSQGNIWGNFPAKELWNAMCPKTTVDNDPNKVENTVGKVAAMAYREHNGQPFNYMVFSYDARGRVVATLRFTDNIGFDAIYYTYNSSNNILTVTTADETKTMKTWYDYDDYGRLSKVWSSHPNDEITNTGLCRDVNTWHNTTPSYQSIPILTKPLNPDIFYYYYKNGQLKYKTVSNGLDKFISTNYRYNTRFWLDSIQTDKTITNNNTPTTTAIFAQGLDYDIKKSYPCISNNTLNHSGPIPIRFYYNFDIMNQLINESANIGLYRYNDFSYDKVGNRTSFYKGVQAQTPISTDFYIYDYTYDVNHPNRLTGLNAVYHAVDNSTQAQMFTTNNYFNNGALKSTDADFIVDISTSSQMWERKQDFYDYDIFGLMNRYYTASDFSVERNCSETDIDFSYRTEWRYKYNPFNEREQKRMYYSPGGNKNGNVYPWVYYQLGVNNQQYVTYNGFNISDPVYFIGNNQVCTNPYPQIVFMYPVEYNIFGADTKADMTYRLDNEGNWRKDIMCYDHLGNVMVSLRANETTGDFDVTGRYYYQPFGERITLGTQTDSNRLTFINKEKDSESGLGDFGVRKYDDGIGRFTSIDPLFEKYPGWSPYQYSLNNPVNLKDDNGKEPQSKAETNPDYYKNVTTISGESVFKAAIQPIDDAKVAVMNLANRLTLGAFNIQPTGLDGDLKTSGEILNASMSTLSVSALSVGIGLVSGEAKVAAELTIRSDVQLFGGRSGELVKNLVGPEQSVVKGGQKGTIFITNDKGQVIIDITKDRVKYIIPGKGFDKTIGNKGKINPTNEHLELINNVWSPK